MTKHNQTKITAEPGKQEIVITREFDAPRELVFKAFTDPELYVYPTHFKISVADASPCVSGRHRDAVLRKF
jgi:hypothetical protein